MDEILRDGCRTLSRAAGQKGRKKRRRRKREAGQEDKAQGSAKEKREKQRETAGQEGSPDSQTKTPQPYTYRTTSYSTADLSLAIPVQQTAMAQIGPQGEARRKGPFLPYERNAGTDRDA